MDDIGCRWTVWAGHGNTPGLKTVCPTPTQLSAQGPSQKGTGSFPTRAYGAIDPLREGSRINEHEAMVPVPDTAG